MNLQKLKSLNHIRLLILGLLAVFTLMAGAQDIPTSYQLDAPFLPGANLPAWLQFPASPSTTYAQLSFLVVPPSTTEGESLLLTIIFNDQESGFLKVYSQSGVSSQTLADNLLEGVNGANQRTLLIPTVPAPTPTIVTLQTGMLELPIRRLIWTWVKPQTILNEPTDSNAVALQGSTVLRDTDISGGPLPIPALQNTAGFVSMPLQDKPDNINGGIEFVLTLDRLPSHARLEAKVLSGSLSTRLLCRLNGHPIPEFTPAPPSLTDPHYLIAPTDAAYAGWLPSSLYIPASLWNTGENVLELTPASYDGQQTVPVISLKDTVLELLFPPN